MTRHIPVRSSERVRTSYLRYGLLIVGETGLVTVFAPDGRRIARVPSISTAHRVVRADRRAA